MYRVHAPKIFEGGRSKDMSMRLAPSRLSIALRNFCPGLYECQFRRHSETLFVLARDHFGGFIF